MYKINYKQFYFDLYWAQIESKKLLVIFYIGNNWNSPMVQNILNFEGERNTEYFDVREKNHNIYHIVKKCYCTLCKELWDCWGRHNVSCSSTEHDLYKFVSDTILGMAEYKKEEQLKITKNKIEQLRKEADELEKELGK